MKYLKYLPFYFYFSIIPIVLVINYFNYCNFVIFSLPILVLVGLSFYLIPKKIREMEYGDLNEAFFIIFIPLMSLILDVLFLSKLETIHLNDGPSIVKKCKVTKVHIEHSNHLYTWETDFVAMINNDTIKKGTITFQSKKVGNTILCYWNIDCPSNYDIEYYMVKNYTDFELINDFAFLEKEKLYSYHDYSLKKPDLVYYQVGYNVVYKALCDTSAIADSTSLLTFTDVVGKDQTVKYSVKGYPSILDTFLVYRNINEKFEDKWHVCAPEVNTPENRAKISDYGYIFHYDVYSKQEIESQCPRIKEYVEQYKKRNQ